MPALRVNVPPSGPAHGPVIAGAKPDLGGVTGVSLVSVNIFYISIITSTHVNNMKAQARKYYRCTVYTNRRTLVARGSPHGPPPLPSPLPAARATGASQTVTPKPTPFNA